MQINTSSYRDKKSVVNKIFPNVVICTLLAEPPPSLSPAENAKVALQAGYVIRYSSHNRVSLPHPIEMKLFNFLLFSSLQGSHQNKIIP